MALSHCDRLCLSTNATSPPTESRWSRCYRFSSEAEAISGGKEDEFLMTGTTARLARARAQF